MANRLHTNIERVRISTGDANYMIASQGNGWAVFQEHDRATCKVTWIGTFTTFGEASEAAVLRKEATR